MIQFLQPIWLWAMTAIAVPLFIHLWNIRQGKTLKVGSIAFLTESTRAHSKSLRVSELLLLLLRCLLLILLALLLSKPLWVKQAGSSGEKGWVLIGPQHFPDTYAHFKPKIDSLLDAGYTLHRFDHTFTAASTSDSSRPEQPGASYWQLVQELNQQAPASLPVYIFTDNQAKHFAGKRPPVSLTLQWYTHTLPDSASYLAHAFITPADSIRMITAHTKAAGSRYSYQNIRAQGNTGSIQSDTAILRISIYTDTYTEDAGYIKAAIQAIRDFTQRRIQVVTVADAKNIPAGSDWLFWLSDKPLPGNLSAKNTLVYATGSLERNAGSFAIAGAATQVPVYATIKNKAALTAVWSTGNGDILLGKERSKSLYHFYSRFNPQWNGLVWSDAFPEIIYQLVGNNPAAAHTNDMVALDPKQVTPEITEESRLLPKELLQHRSDLSGIFWILAFVLFLAERLFTYYSKKNAA